MTQFSGADMLLRFAADDAAVQNSLRSIEQNSFRAFGTAGRAVEAYTNNLNRAVGSLTRVIGIIGGVGAVAGIVVGAGVGVHRAFTAGAREAERIREATRSSASAVEQMRRDAGVVSRIDAEIADNRERAARAVRESFGAGAGNIAQALQISSATPDRFERVARALQAAGVSAESLGRLDVMRAFTQTGPNANAPGLGRAATRAAEGFATDATVEATRQALLALEAAEAIERRAAELERVRQANQSRLRQAEQLESQSRIANFEGRAFDAQDLAAQAAIARQLAALAEQSVADTEAAARAQAMAEQEHLAQIAAIDRARAAAHQAELDRVAAEAAAIAQQKAAAERTVLDARVHTLAISGRIEESQRVAERARHAERLAAIRELADAGQIRGDVAMRTENDLHRQTMRNIDREEARRRQAEGDRVRAAVLDLRRGVAEGLRLGGDEDGARRMELQIESERRQQEIQRSDIPAALKALLLRQERGLLAQRLGAVGGNAGAGLGFGGAVSTAAGTGDVAAAAQLAVGSASASPAAATTANTSATQSNTSAVTANTNAMQGLLNAIQGGILARLG